MTLPLLLKRKRPPLLRLVADHYRVARRYASPLSAARIAVLFARAARKGGVKP